MQMQQVSFNDLPEAVAGISDRLARIETLLTQRKPRTEPKNKWFDLPELCDYLPSKPAKQTVYQWVNERKIPHHKTGKKLRFLKSEIDTWLLAGKRKTVSEIESEAATYLATKKGGAK